MRRPTLRQLEDVRGVCGNGWGDGDYLEMLQTTAEKKRVIRSLQAFEKWIESIGKYQFNSSLV